MYDVEASKAIRDSVYSYHCQVWSPESASYSSVYTVNQSRITYHRYIIHPMAPHYTQVELLATVMR